MRKLPRNFPHAVLLAPLPHSPSSAVHPPLRPAGRHLEQSTFLPQPSWMPRVVGWSEGNPRFVGQSSVRASAHLASLLLPESTTSLQLRGRGGRQGGPSKRAAPTHQASRRMGLLIPQGPLEGDPIQPCPMPWGDKPGRQSVFVSLEHDIP